MFVPVGCTNCGKPFQVSEAALGQSILCPWCQAVVTALPVGTAAGASPAPTPPTTEQPARAESETKPPAPSEPKKGGTERPRAQPVSTAKRVEPLSLDDERPKLVPRPSAPKGVSLFNPVVIVVVLAISLAAMGLTVLVRGYGSGRVQEALWTEYTAPDGSCSVLLPSVPAEERVELDAGGSVTGGKRYVARGWFTRSAAWLAWVDVNPALVKSSVADKDQVFTASVLRAELDREKSRLQGTVTKEATVQSSSGWGYEVHMNTPHGRVIEWLILSSNGPRPRVYVYGVQATNIAHDSAVVRRMFTSLKINE